MKQDLLKLQKDIKMMVIDAETGKKLNLAQKIQLLSLIKKKKLKIRYLLVMININSDK